MMLVLRDQLWANRGGARAPVPDSTDELEEGGCGHVL